MIFHFIGIFYEMKTITKLFILINPMILDIENDSVNCKFYFLVADYLKCVKIYLEVDRIYWRIVYIGSPSMMKDSFVININMDNVFLLHFSQAVNVETVHKLY